MVSALAIHLKHDGVSKQSIHWIINDRLYKNDYILKRLFLKKKNNTFNDKLKQIDYKIASGDKTRQKTKGYEEKKRRKQEKVKKKKMRPKTK